MKKLTFILIFILYSGVIFGQKPHNLEYYMYKADEEHYTHSKQYIEYINEIRNNVDKWRNTEEINKKVNFISNDIEFKNFNSYIKEEMFKYHSHDKLIHEANKRASILLTKKDNIKTPHIFNLDGMNESIGFYTGNSEYEINKLIDDLIIDGKDCLGHRKHILSNDKDYKYIGVGYNKVLNKDNTITVCVVILTSTDNGLNKKDNFNGKVNL